MPSSPSLERLFDLQRLLFSFRNIKRVVNFANGERENDVEHSYSLAMTAWFIAQSFPELNRDLVIRYALVHDLVEIHAGDTFLYADQAVIDTKAAREQAAIIKLAEDWSDFPELLADIQTYERHEATEAKFVYALDKIMPMLIIYLAGGSTWKEEDISLEMIDAKKRAKVDVSPEIAGYYEKLFALLTRSPELFSR